MLRKIVAVVLLCIASFGARALEFTDVYVDPNEIGWGIFVVQSDTFQFLAFFVYGQDGKPTWYSCQLSLDATGKYNGQLYASTGPFYGGPWDPSAQHNVAVGACTFTPSADPLLVLWQLLRLDGGVDQRMHGSQRQRPGVPGPVRVGGCPERRPVRDIDLHLRRPGSQRHRLLGQRRAHAPRQALSA